MGNIFISYSHRDEEWKDRLVKHLKVLEMEGFYSLWEDRQIQAGDKWKAEINKALNDAKIIIMLISAHFLTSGFILGSEVPQALERRQKQGARIFPVIAKPCAWTKVDWLSSIQARPKDGKALSTMSESEADETLAALAIELADLVKTKRKGKTPRKGRFSPIPPEKLSLSKLPNTGEFLFGRKKELQALDKAWTDDHTHVVTIIAWGGVGKTALVNRWLSNMAGKGYRGALRVYGWSFYSQGAEEGKQASADEFLQEALTWFGDADPTEGSAVEKGRRLARLVRKERTLLILDGMEPLQYPPGECHGMDGKLKDQGMRTFLRELAASFTGLCVVTSRETVTDLAQWKNGTVKEMELEHLPEDAGLAYLKKLGVTGSAAEMVRAVQEYGGHALALTLLGHYVKTVYEGDIRKRDRIPALTKEHFKGPHAWKVLAAYEKWLGASPQRDILYIMGLFDRPAEGGAIEALRADPAIPGVTEQLAALEEDDWQEAVSHLREARLLAEENPQKPGTLDCHPLVREYFGAVLQEKNPKGWQEAHKRLYLYFKGVPKKEKPDTLQEMEPLFAAVAHGCRAGLHEEALYDVYWARISRENEQYVVHKLGAFGADLAALANFFEKPWSRPAAGLKEEDQAVILSWSAFGLRAVGRLREAAQPMKAGLAASIRLKDWKECAIISSNLSELLLTLGEVSEAVALGRQSVAFADDSGDWEVQMMFRTTLADALHQAGERAEAEKLFRQAEEIQKKRQPEYPFLYSLWGYRYCDLLLDRGDFDQVLERAEKFFDWRAPSDSLLTISMETLTAGRARQQKTVHENSGDFTAAIAYLERAVKGLRESGNQDDLPRGLLARAACYRLQGLFAKAWDDLNEVREIATLGDMKLFLVDYHLEAGKLRRAEGKEKEAEEHQKEAEVLIAQTGYHRRDIEVSKVN